MRIEDATRFFIALVFLVLLATEINAAQLPGEPKVSPNVLLICVDDLNDWTGFLGGFPGAITPHMDALAARGRNFANAHCDVPVCSASRASVMSGVAATTHGSYELEQGNTILGDDLG